MKKIILLTVFVLLFSTFVACGRKNDISESVDSNTMEVKKRYHTQ